MLDMELLVPQGVQASRRDYCISKIFVCRSCDYQVDLHFPAEFKITLCAECFEKTYPVISSSSSEEDSGASDGDIEPSSSEESELSSASQNQENPER